MNPSSGPTTPGHEPGRALVVGRVDLSEAYAAVRRRGRALRRRRVLSSILAAVVLAGVFSVVGYYYVNSVPLPDAVALPATTTVYYSDGRTVLARLGVQVRIPVSLATLPPYLTSAVLAAEDPGFFGDTGARISWQYARVATGIDVSSAAGKARALVMAWKLEDNYTKNDILGFYLNTVYFGRGAYGIEAAAQSYFHTHAASLTIEQAVVLAGIIRSPGDGTFDPTVHPESARQRFARIVDTMAANGDLAPTTAQSLQVPPVDAYESGVLHSELDRPTGLVVSHVLSELRRTDAFRGSAPDYLENGGFSVITTINATAQAWVEAAADETVPGSVMDRQPHNLQAAAVLVEPGTGRVLAYYGGHDGTGADYAGWYYDGAGEAVGYGAHPPGQSFQVYELAAALKAGISVRSTWDAPPQKQFPKSGRGAANPVRDFAPAACQPSCTLAEALTAALTVPYFALTERLGPAAVVTMARDAGVDDMWTSAAAPDPHQRVDLRGRSGPAVSPRFFGPEVALGQDDVTVLDQANAMATMAAGGRRAPAHFVRRVTKDGATLVAEALPAAGRVLARTAVDDLTWAMGQDHAGALPTGRPSAAKTGVVPLRSSVIETSHAWIVGFTGNLAMAVWVGNAEIELPLRDREGSRVTGSGLPARIYRMVMEGASEALHLPVVRFTAPTFTGDRTAGDATAPR